MLRTVAIRLKIPDNEVYTAMTALRRLGVDLARLERAEILQFEDSGSEEQFVRRIERMETLFNPNNNDSTCSSMDGRAKAKRRGIQEFAANAGTPRRYVGWRLFSGAHAPASVQTVRSR